MLIFEFYPITDENKVMKTNMSSDLIITVTSYHHQCEQETGEWEKELQIRQGNRKGGK